MSKTRLNSSQLQKMRRKAEKDLSYFAHLVNPMRIYGDIHEELFEWWIRDLKRDNQLALIPRAHQKSHCLAVKAAWDITRNPCITILYVSATSRFKAV